ncbi:MAG: aldo/keto reductase [Dehalococcoidia bacterium]|jgi:aryl-alcohol dehydrogenase-like predicted oxidoreductase
MPGLEVRRLGRTEMMPNALGVGAGYLGDPDRTDVEAIETIRGAIQQGVNFVDTSPYYGVSESRVGLALSDHWREKVYLQTKVGSHPRFLRDFSKEATTWSLENSLSMLRTDYLDSVLIHGPRYDIESPLNECLDVLVDWKAKNRIGHIGIGVRQPEFHKRAIETGQIDIILSFFDYSLLSQELTKSTIPLALKNDVGIILGSPLLASLLAGPEPSIDVEEEMSDGKTSALTPAAVGGPTDSAVLPLAHKMWEWCHLRGINIRDLAIQFALQAPLQGNGIVLTGPANLKEFNEVYKSATTEVPESTWQEFRNEFGIESN